MTARLRAEREEKIKQQLEVGNTRPPSPHPGVPAQFLTRRTLAGAQERIKTAAEREAYEREQVRAELVALAREGEKEKLQSRLEELVDEADMHVSVVRGGTGASACSCLTRARAGRGSGLVGRRTAATSAGRRCWGSRPGTGTRRWWSCC